MKKAILIIVVIVIVIALLYLISSMILDSQINKNMLSLKQSGYATTINEIEPAPTQENKKAAELLTTAFQDMKTLEENKSDFAQNLALADSIDYFDNPQLFNKIITENINLIDLILQASKYQTAIFQFKYEDGFNALIPQPLVYVNKFCRILRIYVKKLYAEGKTEQALNILNQTVRLANIAQENTVLFHLIKMLSLKNTFDLTQKTASKASVASLESLISVIEKIDPRASLVQGIQNEIIIGVNEFTNDKNFIKNVRANLEPVTKKIQAYCILLNFAPFKKFEELQFLNLMKKSISLSILPYYKAESDLIKLDKQCKGQSNVFTPINTIPIKQRTEDVETRQDISLLGLKTEIYYKEFKKLPNTLDEINKNNAIDPYSGKQYVYKKFSGEVEGFKIYGVGSDGIDDWGSDKTDIVWIYNFYECIGGQSNKN